jgi:hypothetical protein|tara:strand:- start:15330 stop:16640 length:1311 start_codon:yes stop_codon:yes gene_type:complete
MLRQGLAYLNKSANNASDDSATSSAIQKLQQQFQVGRVADISLNTNSKLFKDAGEWGGIGTIQFQLLDDPSPTSNLNKSVTNYAKPLYPQFQNYPLVNEVVIILRLPSKYQTAATGIEDYYYLNTVGIWNHPNNNGIPSEFEDPNTELQSTQNKSIFEIFAGNTEKSTDETVTLDFNGDSGGQFKETKVNPILSFAGDNIFEGRFGNSIRLGSTSTTDGEIKNNWSNGSAEYGDPIMILKNGQSPDVVKLPGFVPYVESIDFDPSSIYLTSTQQIPIEVAVSKKEAKEGATVPFSDAIKETPQDPRLYTGSQVIINSDRILFNTKEDNILMSSQKSVAIEAINDVGLKSQQGNTNVLSDTGIVALGKIDAGQSLILGDDFIEEFKKVLSNISLVLKALSKETATPGAAAAAAIAKAQLAPIEKAADELKSKFVKTK